MKKKLFLTGVFIIIVAVFAVFYLNNRFTYNDENTLGNTAGNLYNGGLFCESDGFIYFANPYDENCLYKMDAECNEVEKLHSDNVSNINVANGYIYYNRFNHQSSVEEVFKGTLYGVFRLKDGDEKAEELYNGIVENVTLCGNYLYFQGYNDSNMFELRKVKIDGEDGVKISDKAYIPSSISNGYIYFPEVKGNHNLMKLNTESDDISTYKMGNFYLPIVVGNYIYYIDLGNDRKLSRMNMTNESVEVLSEDKCVNYNLSEEAGVIFYQAENSVDDHKLMKMGINGDNAVEIREGDCYNISITSKYTFFIEKIGNETLLYRMKTEGVSVPELYRPVATQ